LDAKGFVSRLERLLVGSDNSASGKFAARLAGFVAGQRARPVTVLQFTAKPRDDGVAALKNVVTEAAKSGQHAVEKEERDTKKADIAVRIEIGQADEVIKAESEKGYDLLVVGLDRATDANGAFSPIVNRIARSFPSPIALVVGNGRLDRLVDAKGFRILVPVNGTEAARNGAEFAFALSPAKDSKVTALHVANRRAADGGRQLSSAAGNRNKRAVLLDVTELGVRYGFPAIETAAHTDIAPDAAILAEAKRIDADLIVIGATRRVGEDLFLGETVANVLQEWRGAIILVVMARETAPQESAAA